MPNKHTLTADGVNLFYVKRFWPGWYRSKLGKTQCPCTMFGGSICDGMPIAEGEQVIKTLYQIGITKSHKAALRLYYWRPDCFDRHMEAAEKRQYEELGVRQRAELHVWFTKAENQYMDRPTRLSMGLIQPGGGSSLGRPQLELDEATKEERHRKQLRFARLYKQLQHKGEIVDRDPVVRLTRDGYIQREMADIVDWLTTNGGLPKRVAQRVNESVSVVPVTTPIVPTTQADSSDNTDYTPEQLEALMTWQAKWKEQEEAASSE